MYLSFLHAVYVLIMPLVVASLYCLVWSSSPLVQEHLMQQKQLKNTQHASLPCAQENPSCMYTRET
ncbi:hypothetical protein BD310DRAFT_920407 [Dichomitus squalens]|uniref:Uncharacterized protein n=1 Tax=Dichomitus squalens TaxID=114155 RepID=A0A4Q9Q2Y6_9APHY|nr:hypothetical protein BD310DRAFT_920407 [Dichomitus squalens]